MLMSEVSSTFRPLRISTIGDSITDQGNAFRSHLGELLQQSHIPYLFVGTKGQRIRHDGYSGALTADINRSVSEWIQISQPNVVLLMIGTNDVWRSQSIKEAVQNLCEIVEKILAAQEGVFVAVAKILPVKPQEKLAREYNDLIEKEFASFTWAQRKIQIVDMFSGFDIEADLKDGVHPNQRGYEKISERWFQYLLAVLSLSEK